jgi:hypothetical protein
VHGNQGVRRLLSDEVTVKDREILRRLQDIIKDEEKETAWNERAT